MSEQGSIYRFDDLIVDCENFRVQKNSQIITLTPRAFDVLLLLIKNAGRVVEKQEIFDKVWKETFVSDNALSKIIKEIRQALEDDANNPRYIETVPKRGYRIIADLHEALLQQTGELNPTELQPSRNKVQSENYRPKAPTQNYQNRWTLVGGILVVALGIAALYYFASGNASSKSIANDPIDSIAVLPFENAAQEPSIEYLSDGLTESLINRLSQLSNLKVMSRSSVFQYKGKEQDAQKVGGELNVRAVLTGSIKQIGEQIVITVRLDDAQNNQHIWGEQYVRKFADILNVQSEIAQEVSNNLRVKLTSADQKRLANHYTENAEAYQLYLKGQYEWKKHTEQDLQKSIEYYSQSLEKDPNYALAYTGLAASYSVLGNSYLSPNETFPKAKAYAARALEIDDSLADAHETMGAIKLLYEWNWADAERELKRAQTLDPNNANAHNLYGYYLKAMGRLDEAKAETIRGQEIDPLSPMINTDVGVNYYYAKQYDEAIAQNEKTINLEPHFFIAYLWLGQAYEQKKMYAEAIATFQKGIDRAERHPQLLASLGRVYALAGERGKAEKSLAELREMSTRRYVSPYLIAVVYAGLGDSEQAFAWLDKAYQDRSFFLIWLKVEPRFDNLRGDPRFNDLLRRVGLKPGI